MSHAPSPVSKYEASDASPRVVAFTALAIVLGVLMSLAVAEAFVRPQAQARALGAAGSFRHGPAERSSIAQAWAEQDAAVRDHLDRYAWVDRSTGIVQIPINRAMELLIAEQREKKAPR